MTRMAEDGFVPVIVRVDNHLVLGIQAISQGVVALPAAFGLAIVMGAWRDDIAHHPRPADAR